MTIINEKVCFCIISKCSHRYVPGSPILGHASELDLLGSISGGSAGGTTLNDGLLAEADLVARVQNQVLVVGAFTGRALKKLAHLCSIVE